MLETLRRRLIRIHLLVLGALLVGYSLVAFTAAESVLTWGLDEANHHLAMGVAARLQGQPVRPDAMQAGLSGLRLTPDERVVVVDPAGRVLASRNGALPAAGPLVPGPATVEAPERYRVLTMAVTRDGRPVAYVRAAHSLAQPEHGMRLLAGALTLLLPLALLVAWAAGNWLAGVALRPVEAAMRREQQFLKDAAHELRNPLAALQMQAELAGANPELPEVARTQLAPLQRTARRMSALVNDLLALSREDAQVAGELRRFAFDELVDEEVAFQTPLAVARGLALAWQAPAEELFVMGDADRLDRAVRNLLDNAIRYAAAGPVVVQVQAQGPNVVLTVSNPAPPIAEADRPRLFERFYRAAGSSEAHPEGTGLGLAIARAIARAHGGELALTSPPGPVVTFTLTVPRA